MRRLTTPAPCLPVLLLAALAFVGCGDDDSPTPDMGSTPDLGSTPDMGPPQPVAIPVCDRGDLVIASLDVSTSTLTLLNPTADTITVDSSSPYQLCQGPGFYDPLPASTPVVIAAGATADFDLSGLPDIVIDATNGTLALYNANSFGDRNAMTDYVCWGTGAGTPRLSEAQEIGADMSILWDDGGCVQLSGATSLHRTPGSDGSTASDYATTAQTITCN